MPYPEEQWEEHTHDAVVHSHRHYHVTHNFIERSGGFEHLSSAHEHEHDHAALTHTHFPHQDFDSEHEGEAHIHEHGDPVRPETSGQGAAKKAVPAKKAAAKKTTKATKKTSEALDMP